MSRYKTLFEELIPYERSTIIWVIRLFSILFYIQVGVFSTLFTIYDITSLASFSDIGQFYIDSTFNLIFPILAIFSILAGIGTWRLKNWARQYTVLVLALSAVLGFLLLATGVSALIGLLEIGIGFTGFWFFTRNSTKEIFQGLDLIQRPSKKSVGSQKPVSLQLCPQCQKKTDSTLEYCTNCGFDTTLPSVNNRVLDLVKEAENEYALKYKALYQFIKEESIDTDVFRVVYTDYITRISSVIQKIKDLVENVIKESEKHNSQLLRYRKRARELRLRVAVKEIPKQTMENEVETINMRIFGINKRLHNLSESIKPLTKTFVKTLTEGKIYRLIHDIISLTESKEYERMPKDLSEMLDKDISTDENIISYIEEISKRLVIPEELKMCETCGKELEISDKCLDCIQKVELKETELKKKK